MLLNPVVFPYRFHHESPTELHIKLMEYNINLPANLSQQIKKKMSTTSTTMTMKKKRSIKSRSNAETKKKKKSQGATQQRMQTDNDEF